MKILIWTQYFWPENFHINAVVRELNKQGIEVTVLTGKPNYPDGEIFEGYKAAGIQHEQYSGFDVIRIPLRQRSKNSGKGLALNYLSFIVSGYLFAPYALRGREFDVVFVYAPSPLLQALPAVYLAWLKQIPLVVWVQDLWPESLAATGIIKNKWVLRFIAIVVRYIYRYSDLILIQSEGFRVSIERLASKKDSIIYFPNSAEAYPMELSVTPKGALIAKSVAEWFSVVFAGNIGVAQSCETIVEAAKRLRSIKNIKFYLIGSGSMADATFKSIEDARLDNIVMTGQVPFEDMASIYASASVLLLTLRDDASLSSTLPSKMQSYLAAGKPILASCNGEAARVVSEGNVGIACSATDANALADAVIKLYEMSPEERARLGGNGRAYFESHFDLKSRVAELAMHFDDVVAAHKCRKKGV